MTESELYCYLRASKLAVLSTVHGGAPQSALVGFAVTPQLELIFDTLATSRKVRNLIASPQCSLVIGWNGEQTAQYEGESRMLHSPELNLYLDLYLAAWPEGAQRLSWPDIVHFLIRPTWIRYSDFNCNPPLIREFRFPSTAPIAPSH